MSTIQDAFKNGQRARELELKAESERSDIQYHKEELAKIMRKMPACDWPMTTLEAKAFKAGEAGKEMPA